MAHDIFALPLPVLEKILRAGLIYFFLVVALRVSGKRELAQLSPLDFVVLLAVANAVQNGIIGKDDSLTGGIIGAITLFVLNYLVGFGTFRSKNLRHALLGTPTDLIVQGQIQFDSLKKEQMTIEDLRVAIERTGATNLDEVEGCTILPSGNFVVSLKPHLEQKHVAEIARKLDLLLAQSKS